MENTVRVAEGETTSICLEKRGFHKEVVAVQVDTCFTGNAKYPLATGECAVTRGCAYYTMP